MTTLQPRGDRVAAKPIAADEVSAGGVVLPDSSRQETNRAVILAVGSGEAVQDLAVDDVVVYAKFGGTTIDVDGKPILMLRDGDIIAIEEAS